MEQHPIAKRVMSVQGNSLAADRLIRDYLPFIRSEVSKVTHGPIDQSSDEMSIGMIAFHEAIESYASDKGAFLSHAALLIKRRLIDYYRREKNHQDVLSLQSPIGDEDMVLEDTLVSGDRPLEESHDLAATQQEIAELAAQLKSFGLSLTDIATDSPKQDRTLERCQRVIHYAREHPEVITELLRTRKLPISALVKGAAVDKKILERHRKYLMAMLIIHSNGYEIIRSHIGMIFKKEGGVRS